MHELHPIDDSVFVNVPVNTTRLFTLHVQIRNNYHNHLKTSITQLNIGYYILLTLE